MDGYSGQVLFGVDVQEKKEMASLTKIMTLYTVLKVSKRLELNLEETEITVSKEAASMVGTKAAICEGDVFKARDLLYGVMLPSGNDAAQCLAEHFGKLIAKEAGKEIEGNVIVARKNFVNEMNENAKEFGLTRTIYNNATGLNDKFNVSTAEDLGRLCSEVMKVSEFRTIVSCGKYNCVARNKEGEEVKYSWNNTNKMLEKGYNGIKTGSTYNAGPCLISSIEVDKRMLIIVLMNSKSANARWIETELLKEWTLNELKSV